MDLYENTWPVENETQRMVVVGAGVVGSGVAQCAAQAGHEVLLIDVGDDVLARARDSIVSSMRLARMLGSGAAASTVDVLGRIRFATSLDGVADATFVIESVTERVEQKAEVLAALDARCGGVDVVFASTTSAIPITRLASFTRRPDRVLGIHFMNPVPLKPMVEMIRGVHTSEATLEKARALLASMGKTPVLVADSPGFVTNRVLMTTINEAAFLVAERVASVDDVDRIFKGCFGHKMGPLETADMIGLDTVLQSIEVLQESFGDSKYRPCPLLRQMVDAGLLGRKSGRGFHNYEVAR